MVDPYFAFPRWAAWEGERKLKSAFYLFIRPKGAQRSLNDCKSSVYKQKVNWPLLRRMSEVGWEFGLHAPIHAKDETETFAEAKQWIEKTIGSPIFGLRHHYWALNWKAPYLTFRKHADAGFRYDSSIAWRDIPGFRAGCCLPYLPFDPQRDEPIRLFELPACLMDGHLIFSDIASGELTQDRRKAVEIGQEILRTVKRHDGLAVVNWHQEAGCNQLVYQGYLNVIEEILQPFLEDQDVWWATPWEICQHWEERCRLLLTDN
jgi:hypothetical protein